MARRRAWPPSDRCDCRVRWSSVVLPAIACRISNGLKADDTVPEIPGRPRASNTFTKINNKHCIMILHLPVDHEDIYERKWNDQTCAHLRTPSSRTSSARHVRRSFWERKDHETYFI